MSSDLQTNAAPMRDALTLYWFRAKRNFGDALSPLIVAWVSGREVVHAGPAKAELVAAGSLLQGMRRRAREAQPGDDKTFVWGTGTMFPIGGQGFENKYRIRILRGPLTASSLGHELRDFGDPGLLAREALGLGTVARRDKVVLIPHINQLDDPMLAEVLRQEPALELVDVRDDPAKVARAIASAAHVISSSLHGLIVADSYGVASSWLDPRGIHAQPAFKFYDYAAGVQRPLAPPVTLAEVPDHVRRLKTPDRLAYAEGIARSKEALVERFPRNLRAA